MHRQFPLSTSSPAARRSGRVFRRTAQPVVYPLWEDVRAAEALARPLRF
jgi:hypothetical protein